MTGLRLVRLITRIAATIVPLFRSLRAFSSFLLFTFLGERTLTSQILILSRFGLILLLLTLLLVTLLRARALITTSIYRRFALILLLRPIGAGPIVALPLLLSDHPAPLLLPLLDAILAST